ncbi:MAG: LacI family DNA-binding transcriptional regulator [Propionicimonas sp.]|uniref:LacI family DNA-binding transcriptional regulator n=1 Tax=Propionicimonas sp. TaxID=1955623 RepID=UPI002B213C11|nr:LacI family DNA-binding transcriptional regulator [Propionicimonas sp.]MEA4945291.1 LacI family DNA-binding transcriptional regulator [Propionicimonas sp.]MEA5052920.1 LacI family DNA-binding transcriptional regulator [Propionicimonas sp.]
MKDVARVAQVSVKTVSRFVNGETNIDTDMADRIEKAIRRLGYRRNLAAASIRPGWTSKMIGLTIGDLANPYYSSLARAIEEEVHKAGYMLIVSSFEEDAARHDRIIERLMEQRVDGMIIVPPGRPGRDWSQVPPPLPPIVFLDRPGGLTTADVVLADNSAGAAEAVLALYDAGARSIAFVGDSIDIYAIRERHSGYLGALQRLGLEADPAAVITGVHSSDDARAAILELLAKDSADAVFAANNRATIGALHAFRESGKCLPIIGFDDFEAAHLIGSGLSVVTPDIDTMGLQAARLMLDRLGGSREPARWVTLPTQVILRGSESWAREGGWPGTAQDRTGKATGL